MGRRRTESEQGSTLLLFPAGVLVLLVLAAIAIDLSTMHLGRRELLRTAAQAADDAAAMLDVAAVRRGDLHTLDRVAAERVVRAEISSAHLAGTVVGPPVVAIDPATGAVTVTVAMDLEHVFGRVVPGIGRTERIVVTVSARLVDVD